VLFRSRG